jgi:hypothetical protein
MFSHCFVWCLVLSLVSFFLLICFDIDSICVNFEVSVSAFTVWDYVRTSVPCSCSFFGFCDRAVQLLFVFRDSKTWFSCVVLWLTTFVPFVHRFLFGLIWHRHIVLSPSVSCYCFNYIDPFVACSVFVSLFGFFDSARLHCLVTLRVCRLGRLRSLLIRALIFDWPRTFRFLIACRT